MHVYRPLIAWLGLVALIFLGRTFVVPKDFGVHDKGYMYSWYRTKNVDDWKEQKVKYQGRDYCKDCHTKEFEANGTSPHSIIQCENCHGAAMEHPSEPEKLAKDRSRELCMRCHTKLPYPQSQRGRLKGIDPKTHNPDSECVSCHNPHHPNLKDM